MSKVTTVTFEDERCSLRTLKEQRIKYEITQKELADKIGVSKQYLTMLEKGTRPLTEGLREKVAHAIDELRILKSNCRLDVMVDYVRIHFVRPDRALGKAV